MTTLCFTAKSSPVGSCSSLMRKILVTSHTLGQSKFTQAAIKYTYAFCLSGQFLISALPSYIQNSSTEDSGQKEMGGLIVGAQDMQGYGSGFCSRLPSQTSSVGLCSSLLPSVWPKFCICKINMSPSYMSSVSLDSLLF